MCCQQNMAVWNSKCWMFSKKTFSHVFLFWAKLVKIEFKARIKELMDPVEEPQWAMCPKEHLFRASIHKYMSASLRFHHFSYQSISRCMRKTANSDTQGCNFYHHLYFGKEKESDMHRATAATAVHNSSHTSKGAIYQNITTFDIVIQQPQRSTWENAEIFTYPSIHRFGCVAKSARLFYACVRESDIIFLGDLFSFQVW